MKSFISAIVIAVMLVGGSLMYISHLERVSDRLISINDRAAAAIRDDDFPRADAAVKELESELERCEPFCAAMGNHEEIDLIESNLSELKTYTAYRHKTDALAKCEVLSFLFCHLPKNSQLRFENIL